MGVSKIAVIGSSLKGHETAAKILKDLQIPQDGAVVLVPHIGVKELMESLGTSQKVRAITDRLTCEGGGVYVSVGYDWYDKAHQYPRSSQKELSLVNFEGEWHFTVGNDTEVEKDVDAALIGIASVFGQNVLAVILEGQGDDGAEGVLAVKRAGGSVLVVEHDPENEWIMPYAANASGAADAVLPLSELRDRIIQFFAK